MFNIIILVNLHFTLENEVLHTKVNSPVAVLVSVYANGCPLNLTLNSDTGGSKL